MSLLDLIRSVADQLHDLADTLETNGVSADSSVAAHPTDAPGTSSPPAPSPAQSEPQIDPVTGEPEAPTVGSLVVDASPSAQRAPVFEPEAEPAEPAEHKPLSDEPPELEPETVGGAVFDAAPKITDEQADIALDVYGTERLTEELARRQQAAIVKADAEKSVLGPLEPMEGHS